MAVNPLSLEVQSDASFEEEAIQKAILRTAAEMTDQGVPVTRVTLYDRLRTDGVIDGSSQQDRERFVMGFIHLNASPLNYLSEIMDPKTGNTVTHRANGQSAAELRITAPGRAELARLERR